MRRWAGDKFQGDSGRAGLLQLEAEVCKGDVGAEAGRRGGGGASAWAAVEAPWQPSKSVRAAEKLRGLLVPREPP